MRARHRFEHSATLAGARSRCRRPAIRRIIPLTAVDASEVRNCVGKWIAVHNSHWPVVTIAAS
jgi:hypothetical protein